MQVPTIYLLFFVFVYAACSENTPPAARKHSSARNSFVPTTPASTNNNDTGNGDVEPEATPNIYSESAKVMQGKYASQYGAGFGIHEGLDCGGALIFSKPVDAETIEVSVNYPLLGDWTDEMTCEFDKRRAPPAGGKTYFGLGGYNCKSKDVKGRFVSIAKEKHKYTIYGGNPETGNAGWSTPLHKCKVLPGGPANNDFDNDDDFDADDEDFENDEEDFDNENDDFDNEDDF